MFGHDDQDDKKTDDAVTVSPTTDATSTDVTTDSAPAVDGSADLSAPAVPASDPAPSDTSSSDSEETPMLASTGTPDPAPSEPAPGDVTSTETTSADIDTSGTDDTAPVFSDTESTTSSSSDDDELLSLKKDAIDELAPLLDQLEQSPEEKFKTTMMMIQATDSSNLVKVAHAAAKDIPDEKVRAQALLDIVNEINYFTHPSTNDKD